ncbi:MAG: type II secretion system F family protein [Micrococcaceae bacterium]
MSLCLELIASTMRIGCSLYRSLELIASSLDDSEQKELNTVLTLLNLGSDWDQAWQHTEGKLQQLGRHIKIAQQGISTHQILHARAKTYRKEQHTIMLEKIEALSIKLLMPLGLLALPAFIAIGIIPTIICLVQTLTL